MYECRAIREDHDIEPATCDLIFDSYVYAANKQIDSAILCAEIVLEYALNKKEIGLAKKCMPQLAKLYTTNQDLTKAVEMYERIFFLNQQQKIISQIENINEQPNNKTMTNSKLGSSSNSYGLAILALILIGFSLSFWKKNNNKSQIKSLHQDILLKTDLLTRAKLAQQQQLDFLQGLKGDIRQLGRDKINLHKHINHTINKINNSIDFQEQWYNVHMYFSERYPYFLNKLKEQYPKLTESEIRHCMFIKLNLSTEEIAQILNIELASVSSARYRLKKKVNLEELSVLA